MTKRKPIKRKNPTKKRSVAHKRAAVSGSTVGFCPLCGRIDIPRGLKLADHLETHDLNVADVDTAGVDEFGDAMDRFEPGVRDYQRVVRKVFQGAVQVNELIRMESLKDRRRNAPRTIDRKVRWDNTLGRLVLIDNKGE